jgi:hypothetical protein
MSAANVLDMQNARGGVSDMGIDNSTGMQRMAGGGITGNGELNLNIPLNFGSGGGEGGVFGQGPLNLGQGNNTGFGQAAADVYRPGAGASSGPSEFFPPKPSSTFGPTQNPGQNMTGGGMLAGMGGTAANGFMSPAGGGFGQGNSPFGLNENPFNLGTQLASRLGSANQNPFAGQPTPEMATSQREAMFNPAVDLADLQRTVGDREQSFDEFQSQRKMRRHPGDQVPTDAQIQSSYQNYLQGRNDNLAKINDLQQQLSRKAQEKEMFDRVKAMQAGYGNGLGNSLGNGLGGGLADIRRQLGGNLDAATSDLLHVLRPGTVEYNNHMNNRGAGTSTFGRFAAGGAIPSHSASHLGDYSDGGRLLKGPGDGVSDSIPAVIGQRRPARLADGEFVVPARIVSELGNGSTEAGARKLYAMMDRVQRARRKTTGKNRVAANTRADKHLPA